jgi:hypothetical protein
LRPAGLPPVGKRVNWFTSGNTGKPATQQFLLHDNRDVVDGVYTCCGVGGFEANGTLRLPELDYDGDIAPYREAGIAYWTTFGGSSLALPAWEQREATADAILAWVLKYNLTGVHNDWESHGDEGVDAYKFYDFWGAVAAKLHPHGRGVGTCVETAPANVSHPWAPRTPSNDTTWHSYMCVARRPPRSLRSSPFPRHGPHPPSTPAPTPRGDAVVRFNWDYPLALPYIDLVTNMATYPMMHTTDGDSGWCAAFPNTTWCHAGCEDFVDHLTPAYKYLEQEECDPDRHTVAQWCGLKGQVQDMIDAGADPASGQLSPGMWMNNCVKTSQFPDGVTAQGWTQPSLRAFLDFLDSVGVRSIDMWTSNLSDNDLDTCDWFVPELRRWRSRP